MAIKICLDAGHDGKYNQSGVVPAYYESDFNWKLYTKLKKYLEEYDITVIGTRANQNVEMGTISRGKKSAGCDLFISLHANAADRASADYVLVIEMLTKKKHDLAVKFAKAIKEVMGTKENYEVTTKKKDDGGEWYGVLQGCDAVGNDSGFIIEHSFYTNKAMATWMMKDENITKLAQLEADIIADYFGVSKPANPTPASSTFKVGDTVSIVEGAVYTTGAKVPSWVREKQWIIKSISGSVAIIDKSADGKSSINSPIDVKYLINQTPSTPEEPVVTVKTYEVVTTINRYNSEGNAKARTNPTGTYAPGTYYIYNKYPNGSQGMLNISKDKTGNTPGSWINPSDNVKKEVVVETPKPVEQPKPTTTPDPIPEQEPVPEVIPDITPEPAPEIIIPEPEVIEPEVVVPESEATEPEIIIPEPTTIPNIEIPDAPTQPEAPSIGNAIGTVILNFLVEYVFTPLINWVKGLFSKGK